jgi:hypothetical protein
VLCGCYDCGQRGRVHLPVNRRELSPDMRRQSSLLYTTTSVRYFSCNFRRRPQLDGRSAIAYRVAPVGIGCAKGSKEFTSVHQRAHV